MNRVSGWLLAAIAVVVFICAVAWLPSQTPGRSPRVVVAPGEGKQTIEIASALLKNNRAPTSAPQSPSVFGFVIDEFGAPVSGSLVALFESGQEHPEIGNLIAENRCVITNSEGEFRLKWPSRIESEHCRLVVRHDDFVPAGVELSEPEPESVEPIRVVLKRGLQIAGQVVIGADRVPVNGVRVTARGMRASLQTDLASRYADDRACVSSAVTGPDGRYEIRGLRPGWYRIGPVATGLALLARIDAAGISSGSVVVRAGSIAPNLVVRALGIAHVVFEDESTGDRVGVATSTISFASERKNAIEVFPAQRVVAEGKFQGRTSPDEIILQYESHEWPIPPDWMVSGTVTLQDYGRVNVRATLFAVGHAEATRPQVVKVRSAKRMGRCQFSVVDGRGASVGPSVRWVKLVPTGAGDSRTLPITFDSDGSSQPMTIPQGEYSVEPVRLSFSGFRCDRVLSVTDHGVATAALRLDSGAVVVEVLDDQGAAIDGVGLRWGEGHQPVGIRLDESGTRTLPGGGWGPPPGGGVLASTIRTLWRREGPFTVEAARPGYRPERTYFDMIAGRVTRITIRMRRCNGDEDWMFRDDNDGRTLKQLAEVR